MPRWALRVAPRIDRITPATATATGPVVFFLPAHDEAPRIAAVIGGIPAEICGHPVEVLVVDDGSTDETAAVARTHGATVVQHGTNRGLGAAVRSGFRSAADFDPAAVVFCDADGEYDPAAVADLVAPIVDGVADYVVGSRFTGHIEHMRPHRRLGNRVLTRWMRWVTREPITDGQSGFRALSGRAAASARVGHDYNYAQVLTIELVQAGFVMTEVPITYRFRTSGTSFVRLGRYLWRVVPTVLRQLGTPPESAPWERRGRRACDHEPDTSLRVDVTLNSCGDLEIVDPEGNQHVVAAVAHGADICLDRSRVRVGQHDVLRADHDGDRAFGGLPERDVAQSRTRR